MMSSVNLNSSSANSAATPRTNAYNPQARYAAGHPQRTDGPVPPHGHAAYQQAFGASVLPGAEAGRLRTEQCVLEFLYKVTELVLQSRVHLPADTTRHQATSARRGWLNLAIEDVQYVRDSLAAWRDDVHIPLTIDIFWDGDPDQRVLLERWSIVYTDGFADPFDSFDVHGRRHHSGMGSIGGPKGYASTGKSRDVLQIVKEMMRKMAVLLRALHSFMRLLPAHRFFRQSYPSTLSYEIHSCKESELLGGFEQDVATSYYSFVPISTPFGFVKISTIYRRDCSAVERRRKRVSKEILQENFIIQDYVPASPELMAASAPASSRQQSFATPMQPAVPLMIPAPGSPRRLSSPRAGDAVEHRRRSSPEVLVDDASGRAGAVRRVQLQHTSQPMAIPHQVKSPAHTTFEERSESAASAVEIPASKPVSVPHHPHSYDDPARLRMIPTNPNVAPAPYGYGNVTMERSQTPPVVGLSTSSGGFSGGAGSFQDYSLSSPHHPLSTPPRHPNSLLTPRTSGRTSFVSSVSASGGKRASNEFAYRASLENFSLDGSSPSQAQAPQNLSPSRSASRDRSQTFHFRTRRTGSFDSQRSDTPELAGGMSSGGDNRHSSGTSPHLTPPFAAGSPPPDEEEGHDSSTARGHSSSNAAIVLRRASHEQSPKLAGTPVFTSSPPFQANPSELLSTSPGYSHSKHFEALRRGAPTFTSTEVACARSGSFHFGTGSVRSGGGSSLAMANPVGRCPGSIASSENKDRAFSTDIQENSAGIWGVSPDSPDKFALSVGASTRRRLLASADGGGGEATSTNAVAARGADGGSHVDHEMLMLPFALGDDLDNHSSRTTVTATSSVSERPSLGSETGSQPRAGTTIDLLAWDTASVGSFLQQFKNAPRLQTFEAANETRSSDAEQHERPEAAKHARPNAEGDDGASAAVASFFDDELESFRNLRNELSQAL